jgi:hypothetical protein
LHSDRRLETGHTQKHPATSGRPNTPLSTIGVTFAPAAAGATAATITGTGLAASPPDGMSPAFDDTVESFVSVAPGTYTCTAVL